MDKTKQGVWPRPFCPIHFPKVNAALVFGHFPKTKPSRGVWAEPSRRVWAEPWRGVWTKPKTKQGGLD